MKCCICGKEFERDIYLDNDYKVYCKNCVNNEKAVLYFRREKEIINRIKARKYFYKTKYELAFDMYDKTKDKIYFLEYQNYKSLYNETLLMETRILKNIKVKNEKN